MRKIDAIMGWENPVSKWLNCNNQQRTFILASLINARLPTRQELETICKDAGALTNLFEFSLALLDRNIVLPPALGGVFDPSEITAIQGPITVWLQIFQVIANLRKGDRDKAYDGWQLCAKTSKMCGFQLATPSQSEGLDGGEQPQGLPIYS